MRTLFHRKCRDQDASTCYMTAGPLWPAEGCQPHEYILQGPTILPALDHQHAHVGDRGSPVVRPKYQISWWYRHTLGGTKILFPPDRLFILARS